jgi:hypothetical protein
MSPRHRSAWSNTGARRCSSPSRPAASFLIAGKSTLPVPICQRIRIIMKDRGRSVVTSTRRERGSSRFRMPSRLSNASAWRQRLAPAKDSTLLLGRYRCRSQTLQSECASCNDGGTHCGQPRADVRRLRHVSPGDRDGSSGSWVGCPLVRRQGSVPRRRGGARLRRPRRVPSRDGPIDRAAVAGESQACSSCGHCGYANRASVTLH